MDQYDVLETIGTGAFGKVCKIRRKADDKILVWKELNYGSMNEHEKQQLVAEVNILRELRNPFIVRYYDRIVDKKTTRLYIVMEHCSGGDLGRIIRKCKRDRVNLDEAIIWKVLAQIVIALKDCHRRTENGECRPILHRDLKPANIMLDQNENLKIGDFGLAKELSSGSKLAKTNVGTPFYMSPELINGKKYDERSDIWSVGCLLYELAALRPPFDASNQLSLAVKINAGRFHRIPNKYSEDLNAAIKSMLLVDSSRRPRIEEIEALPALQSALRQANVIVKEAQLHQSYSAKWRELRAWEESLQSREEKIKTQEAQLLAREKSLIARESRSQRSEQAYPIRRTSSAPMEVNLEECDSDDDGDRRMSLQEECDTQPRAAPFTIYNDTSEQKDDFSAGVARARELLGKPRLMTAEAAGLLGNRQKPKTSETHTQPSAFYRNYLVNKKISEENMSENVNPFTKRHQTGGNNYKGCRQAPPPPHAGNCRKDNAGDTDNTCGSATKRPRHEVQYNAHKAAPSVHVDLQTLIAAGKGKFESL